MTVSSKMNAVTRPGVFSYFGPGGLSYGSDKTLSTPTSGKDDAKGKDESAGTGQGLRRWRRTGSSNQPSELLKFLALNALELGAPASGAALQTRTSQWFQLAGHPGSLAPAGPGTVWKRGPAPGTPHPERDAYIELSACPRMRLATAECHRELFYDGERFLELQDLLHGFRDPHVMDVKMGTRTFLETEVDNTQARSDLYEKMMQVDPEAPTPAEHEARAITKLRYMQFRERQSSTATEGFRIEAVKLPGAPPCTDLKLIKTRRQVLTTVTRFLDGREEVRRRLVRRLLEMRSLLEESDFFRTHEVVGSSIFMIFDERRVGAWLIDFAKTSRVPEGVTITHRDPWAVGNHEEGFLFGLDRLIEVMEMIDVNQNYSTQDESARVGR